MNFNFDVDLTEVAFCGYVGATPLNFMDQILLNFDWILHVYGVPDR